MGNRIWLDFNVGLKLTWFQSGGSEFLWFECRDRNWRGFCVSVEHDLFWVRGSRIYSVFVSGHRNQLEWGSTLTSFWLWGRDYLGFCVGTEIDSVLARDSKIACFLREGQDLLRTVCTPKLLGFNVSIETVLFYVRAERYLILMRRSIILFFE